MACVLQNKGASLTEWCGLCFTKLRGLFLAKWSGLFLTEWSGPFATECLTIWNGHALVYVGSKRNVACVQCQEKACKADWYPVNNWLGQWYICRKLSVTPAFYKTTRKWTLSQNKAAYVLHRKLIKWPLSDFWQNKVAFIPRNVACVPVLHVRKVVYYFT